MQTTEKLTTLREKLRDAGMDGYVVTTGDFHGSEYVGSFFKTRAWLSGFTGSAGTLVVLPERAALWTDGRYFLQAGQQLAGSTIELMREGQPGVPSVADFLAEHLPRGGTLGFDGRTVSAAFARGLEKALAPREIRFAADRDLVGEIWADRPALSAEPVWELDAALAGLTREEKLALLRRDMAAQDADTLLLTALDEIAWTLNLRGGDVACTPVFLSFLLIGRECAVLCVQRQILSPEIKRVLAACGVELAPYADIYDRIAHLPAGTTLLADSASANSRIIRSVPHGVTLLDRPRPSRPMPNRQTSAPPTSRTASPSAASCTGSRPASAMKGSPSAPLRRSSRASAPNRRTISARASIPSRPMARTRPSSTMTPRSRQRKPVSPRAACACSIPAGTICRARPTSPAPSRSAP